ncbi:MAG: glycosyltransferase family 2 protein [Bacteroidales bacterium]|nr:glycosyltransferase family 2 protein [Bacteroidales bacterium]
MNILFWLLLGLIIYTYIGYGIIVGIVVKLFKLNKKNEPKIEDWPEVTLFVAAYNEKDFVDIKVKNSFELDYPKDKLKHMWVTDGSNDGTPDILRRYENITVLHEDKRSGKTAAINRGIDYVDTSIVVFCDGNTILSKSTIKDIVKAFEDPKVGCVAGEKRIFKKDTDSASGSGEGAYWKYESVLKKLDSALYSAVGGVGELFAVRKELFDKIENDTILDDFVITLRIAMKGYKIKYVPEATASETPSDNVKEELKRKIRISAGGYQSISRLPGLLNPFKYGILSFQFWSRKVFRWVVVPISMILLIPINLYLAYASHFDFQNTFTIVLLLQLLFYGLVLFGKIFSNVNIKLKVLFLPYYIFIMNYAAILGGIRYFKGNQSVNWERAKRAQM